MPASRQFRLGIAARKPFIGLANGHSTLNPCNAGIYPLADAADRAIREAGGMPQMFGTITVTDGISMGTEGTKAHGAEGRASFLC